MEAIRNFYLEHISFYALLGDIDRQRARNASSIEGDSSSPEDTEDVWNREIARACETICGIMEDMFDILSTRTSESAV